MALIPGTLPSDTCYGTPQDLLELFAQYLDVPAFALNSKVVFGTSSAGLTADVVWFDTTVPTNPILKITVSGGFTDYIQNYINQASSADAIVGADFILFSDTSASGATKKSLVSAIAALAVPAAGSITYPMLSTSATEADNAAKRVAKAWVNFNGTGTVAIRDDFNVSSITDNGTGNYTVNYSVALPNANYAAQGFMQLDATIDDQNGTINIRRGVASPVTTASINVATGYGLTRTDAVIVCVSVFSS